MRSTFTIEYRTTWGESLSLVSQDRMYPMSYGDGGIWSVTIPRCTEAFTRDYGYVVVRDSLVVRTEWDRHHGSPAAEIMDAWIDCPIQGCPFPRRHSADLFDRPGIRLAGTAVPVFSLRSANDFGAGEFSDIRLLADWAALTGQRIIQLLPVNDTTRLGGWSDSYPYNPVSSFALHPIYINLQEAGVVADSGFLKLQAELNALPDVDYPRVMREKMRLLREAFASTGKKVLASAPFRRFLKENSFWLEPYADFCARRDGDGCPQFHCFVQYHLHVQLSGACSYAHALGIALKGDLPIGVGADSVDAALHPELFNLDCTAGAPPDYFSADGQNWGFPTYNWDAMEKDGYAWWKARLRKMAAYFDAFRIDHILGWFRIWEIPSGVKSGKEGHFNPAMPYSRQEIEASSLPVEGLFVEDGRRKGFFHPLISPDTSSLNDWQRSTFNAMWEDFFFHRHEDFWKRNARKKLPGLLGATGMLACGEDLGMVPDCVPQVMWDEKILSLKMQRMGASDFPYLSVSTTASHDMETLRMWQPGWDAGRCAQFVAEHLNTGSMLAIIPLQDWFAAYDGTRREDFRNERINDPADPDNKWKYRMHLSLEQITENPGFCTRVRGLVADSGRIVSD